MKIPWSETERLHGQSMTAGHGIYIEYSWISWRSINLSPCFSMFIHERSSSVLDHFHEFVMLNSGCGNGDVHSSYGKLAFSVAGAGST